MNGPCFLPAYRCLERSMPPSPRCTLRTVHRCLLSAAAVSCADVWCALCLQAAESLHLVSDGLLFLGSATSAFDCLLFVCARSPDSVAARAPAVGWAGAKTGPERAPRRPALHSGAPRACRAPALLVSSNASLSLRRAARGRKVSGRAVASGSRVLHVSLVLYLFSDPQPCRIRAC